MELEKENKRKSMAAAEVAVEATATSTEGTRGGGGDDDDAEIERRVKALQRLVPGGEGMEMDALFEETAGYIEELRARVTVMRSLAELIDAVTKDERLMRI